MSEEISPSLHLTLYLYNFSFYYKSEVRNQSCISIWDKSFNKRYFIVEKQTARHFVQYLNFFQTHLPLYVTQIINPLLIQWSKLQWWNPYIPYCFTSVKSLLFQHAYLLIQSALVLKQKLWFSCTFHRTCLQ